MLDAQKKIETDKKFSWNQTQRDAFTLNEKFEWMLKKILLEFYRPSHIQMHGKPWSNAINL